MPATLTRRSFLGCAAFGVCKATTGWAADNTASRAFPLLRWTTVSEVRSQPEEVWRLVDLINAYRTANRLPAAPLSPRLTIVAMEHVKDLLHNRPHAATGNLHSWSPNEQWSGGIYRPDDKNTWPVMWEKPREITGYDGYGFEIAAADVDNPGHALEAWRGSPSHRDVILSRGVWSKPRLRWQALGAVFYRGYACAWFGAAEDV